MKGMEEERGCTCSGFIYYRECRDDGSIRQGFPASQGRCQQYINKVRNVVSLVIVSLQPFFGAFPVLLHLEHLVRHRGLEFVNALELWMVTLQLWNEAQEWHIVAYDECCSSTMRSVYHLLQVFLLLLILRSVSIIPVKISVEEVRITTEENTHTIIKLALMFHGDLARVLRPKPSLLRITKGGQLDLLPQVSDAWSLAMLCLLHSRPTHKIYLWMSLAQRTNIESSSFKPPHQHQAMHWKLTKHGKSIVWKQPTPDPQFGWIKE